ncbi:MAG TPA: hypothetical protein EYO88_02895 [Alphaproteobacteria bacterium]|nr:MAG: hypothetical protein CFH36_00346 [Alphaproteobacteria bacterium MarineAlpha9_Bin6]PPR38419.1 MAG: hypothetical protein CFH35_01147 [Alphaproteobacteria bacterium MarineAlpha9_Bin5]HIA21359.1 hypothetical protein [Alphaproteobacteria bacterium]HIB18967.1 hypothetical protein [Alphaproteobacteria bacterium]HIC71025.1 hypothetical protein [Alphaproteobacteria bacterium]
MIILGVLIIAGLTIIGITIASRLHGMSQDLGKLVIPDTIPLSAPQGSRIRAVDADEGLLFVLLDTPSGDIVMIVELGSGRVIGRLELVNEP